MPTDTPPRKARSRFQRKSASVSVSIKVIASALLCKRMARSSSSRSRVTFESLADSSIVQPSGPCRFEKWTRALPGACARRSDGGDDRAGHQCAVRYLTDDPAQYTKAAGFIDAATDGGERLVVNAVVLCELEWVLGTAYGYSREEIARALGQILETAQFDVERLDEARQALGDFRSTKATSATRS